MDERTVYLYARHQNMDDEEAAMFVDWYYANMQDYPSLLDSLEIFSAVLGD